MQLARQSEPFGLAGIEELIVGSNNFYKHFLDLSRQASIVKDVLQRGWRRNFG
jgi:hypothetical protein